MTDMKKAALDAADRLARENRLSPVDGLKDTKSWLVPIDKRINSTLQAAFLEGIVYASKILDEQSKTAQGEPHAG